MFVVNFKLFNRRAVAAYVLGSVAVIGFFILLINSSNGSADKDIICSSESSVADYIASFGYEIGEAKIDEIIIPETFNDVYDNYNDIQKSQGFDLAMYKGEKVRRYTYRVLNYHDQDINVFAEVLIFDEKVIAADVYTTEVDGFIKPLK